MGFLFLGERTARMGTVPEYHRCKNQGAYTTLLRKPRENLATRNGMCKLNM